MAIGGLYYSGDWIYLDTTEMFDYTDWTTTSSSKWRAASPLPTPIYGHQAVTLANSVIVFGKNHSKNQTMANLTLLNAGGRYLPNGSSLRTITKYNATNDEWENVGNMGTARNYHSVELLDVCP